MLSALAEPGLPPVQDEALDMCIRPAVADTNKPCSTWSDVKVAIGGESNEYSYSRPLSTSIGVQSSCDVPCVVNTAIADAYRPAEVVTVATRMACALNSAIDVFDGLVAASHIATSRRQGSFR